VPPSLPDLGQSEHGPAAGPGETWAERTLTTSTGLINDAIGKPAELLNLSQKCLDDGLVHQAATAFVLGPVNNGARFLHDLLGDPNELAVSGYVLGLTLLGRHSLDLLHPTARAQRSLREASDSSRNPRVEILDQPSDDAHGIPKQGAIGRPMNVRFDDRGIDAQLLAIFEPAGDRRPHHCIVDGFERLWGKAIEGSVEGIVFGNGLAVESREAAQRVPVSDALAQFAIIPALDPHESQRPEDLLGGQAASPCSWPFEPSLEIAPHPFHDLRMLVYEMRDPLQNGIELDALAHELEVGEADLRIGCSRHVDSFIKLSTVECQSESDRTGVWPDSYFFASRPKSSEHEDTTRISGTEDREAQGGDRGPGGPAPGCDVATVQHMRQSEVSVQSDSADQARSLSSGELYLARQEHDAIGPERGCRGGQTAITKLPTAPKAGGTVGHSGNAAVAPQACRAARTDGPRRKKACQIANSQGKRGLAQVSELHGIPQDTSVQRVTGFATETN